MVREAGRSSLSDCNVVEDPRITSPQSACRAADKREIHRWRMREMMPERGNSADAYWTWNEVDRFRAYRSRGDRGNGRNAVFPSAPLGENGVQRRRGVSEKSSIGDSRLSRVLRRRHKWRRPEE